MKAIVLISLLTLICLSGLAQSAADQISAQIKWSPKVDVRYFDIFDYSFFDIIDGNALVLGKRNAILPTNVYYNIHQFNNSLILNRALRFDNRLDNDYLNSVSTINIGNKTYLVSSIDEKNTDRNVLYAQVLNPTTLKPEREAIKLAEINTEGFLRFNSGSFHFTTSTDSALVLLFYSQPFERNESQKFGFKIFNSQLQELWAKDVVLAGKDEIAEIVNYAVGGDGKVYLLLKSYDDRRRAIRGNNPDYLYEILIFQNNIDNPIRKEIVIEDRNILSLSMYVTVDGNVSLTGLYSNKESRSNGVFHSKLDGKTGESIYTSIVSYEDIGNEYLEDDKIRKLLKGDKDLSLYSFQSRNVIPTDEGGLYFITENSFTRVNVDNSEFGYVSTTYIDLSIMIIRIDSLGQIEWWTTVKKKQVAGDRNFQQHHSFNSFYHNGTLHLLFNDHKNNVPRGSNNTIRGFNPGANSVLKLVSIDRNGVTTQTVLDDFKTSRVNILPGKTVSISDNEIYLIGIRRFSIPFIKKIAFYRLGKLTLH